MISPVTSTVITSVVVVGGSYADGGHVDIKYVVGAGIVALFLAALSEVNLPLAEQFGILIMITALFIYGPAIAKKIK